MPEEFVKNQCFDFSKLFDDARQIRVQNLWPTVHLVWETLINCRVVGELSSLKEPQEEAPRKELRIGLQEEIGVFPGHVEEVIQAFSGDDVRNEVPSFKKLLEIICGGTLVQKCSFCDASLTVSECLIQSWCSRECQQKDREEKHKEFCIKGAEQRKVKGALRSGGKRR